MDKRDSRALKLVMVLVVALVAIAVYTFAAAPDAWGGIVNNSGSTTEDSLTMPFRVLDSLGNSVNLASGDSIYLVVIGPSGIVTRQDSSLYNGSKIVSGAWSGGFPNSYGWRDAATNLVSTGTDGVYMWSIMVHDKTSANLITQTVGEFQLYEASNFSLIASGAVNAAATGAAMTLVSGAVTAAAVAPGAIDADAIADNAIDAGAIATGAVDADAIADNSIDAGAVADGAIDAGAIATAALDADAIGTGAIDFGVELDTAGLGASPWANGTRTLTANGGLTYDANITQVGGDAITDNADGRLEVNVEEWHDGQIPTQSVAGTPEVDLQYYEGADGVDAEVQSEATDALNAYDPPTHAEMTNELAGDVDTNLTLPLTAAATANAVWNEDTASHSTAGSYGVLLKDTSAYQGSASALDSNAVYGAMAQVVDDSGTVCVGGVEALSDTVWAIDTSGTDTAIPKVTITARNASGAKLDGGETNGSGYVVLHLPQSTSVTLTPFSLGHVWSEKTITTESGTTDTDSIFGYNIPDATPAGSHLAVVAVRVDRLGLGISSDSLIGINVIATLTAGDTTKYLRDTTGSEDYIVPLPLVQSDVTTSSGGATLFLAWNENFTAFNWWDIRVVLNGQTIASRSVYIEYGTVTADFFSLPAPTGFEQ